MGSTDFIPESAQSLNAGITVSALIVGVSQLLFLVNIFWSLRRREPAGHNPWDATSLEWQTEHVPPHHGNWGAELPKVYRWAYDYSVPGSELDYIPQNHPVTEAEGTAADDEHTSEKSV